MDDKYYIDNEEVSKNIFDQFQKLKEIKEEAQQIIEDEPVVILKCKPCYNFQTIEFEWEVNTEEDVLAMFDFYANILKGLKKITDGEAENKEEPASEKQIEVMDKFHIKYPKNVTKKEAQELIKKSMGK